eukprot:TRINITY_DN11447_c0_g1_i3.p1 TRINITY_DN11447_c0_g1~~TRINITY_DN11447_c0_g1_i3.p1  ORF type:complete len:268 (+),score=53.66 TRINITY_DN11447_c0_g1_i3:1-804(+)
MIRRPPRSTHCISSAASDVYKRQVHGKEGGERIGYVIGTQIVPIIVKLAGHADMDISVSCIRILGTITSGLDTETQTVINAGGIEALKNAMQSSSVNTRKEACWAISNIAAGTSDQVTQLINVDILFLAYNVLKEDDFKVKIEAAWIISNITSKMEAKYITYVLNSGLLTILPTLLKANDAKLLGVILQFVVNILRKAKVFYGDVNPVESYIMKSECIGIVEGLQYHSNQIIYMFAIKIIEENFAQDYVEEDLGSGNINVGTSIFDF